MEKTAKPVTAAYFDENEMPEPVELKGYEIFLGRPPAISSSDSQLLNAFREDLIATFIKHRLFIKAEGNDLIIHKLPTGEEFTPEWLRERMPILD